jgi:hypothetical protein
MAIKVDEWLTAQKPARDLSGAERGVKVSLRWHASVVMPLSSVDLLRSRAAQFQWTQVRYRSAALAVTKEGKASFALLPAPPRNKFH